MVDLHREIRSENEASFQDRMYTDYPRLGEAIFKKVSEIKKIIRVISLRFLIKYFFFTIKPLKRIKYTLFWNEIYNILLSFVAEPID